MLNSALSPSVVKTALDDVFFPTYEAARHPQYADATNPAVFKQGIADSAAVIWEIYKGVGRWTTRAEEQDVPQANPRVTNQKTFSVLTYSRAVDIPKTFFDDNKHGVYEKTVQDMALRARTARDHGAFDVYRGAFGTTTTHDGVALISNNHRNLSNSTVDNLLTGDLSETTLNTAIVQLLELKAEDNEIDGSVATTLLVAPADYKLACEITESELRSGTANNDMNVYSDKYGIRVLTSQFLGAAAGGDDDAWFLLSDTHSIYRFVRQGVETALVDWRTQRNNNYVYKGEFREIVGAMSFEGIVGSAGA